MLDVNLLRKQFRTRRKLPIRESRSVNRMHRMVLREGQELTSFIGILNTAMQFLSEKKNETSELPPDSPERLLIEAIDGTLHKHALSKEEAPTNEIIRQQISGLAAALDEHLSGQGTGSSDFLSYLEKLKEGLLDLHNSIEPNEDISEPVGGDAEGESPAPSPDSPDGPSEEPEQPPEDEISQLSRQLGLNDADQPPQQPPQ